MKNLIHQMAYFLKLIISCLIISHSHTIWMSVAIWEFEQLSIISCRIAYRTLCILFSGLIIRKVQQIYLLISNFWVCFQSLILTISNFNYVWREHLSSKLSLYTLSYSLCWYLRIRCRNQVNHGNQVNLLILQT